MQSGLDRAIEAAGSLKGLASLLEVTPQVVANWKARQVPAERCPEIERALDGKVTCAELRPDIFGGDRAAS